MIEGEATLMRYNRGLARVTGLGELVNPRQSNSGQLLPIAEEKDKEIRGRFVSLAVVARQYLCIC